MNNSRRHLLTYGAAIAIPILLASVYLRTCAAEPKMGGQGFRNMSDGALTAPSNVTYSTADAVYPADVGYYNVRNYGAAGDGSTDDTAAIRAAMSDALGGLHQPNHGPGSRGSTVYFPSGTYLVSDSLVWASYGHHDAQVSAQVDPQRGCVTSLQVVAGGSGYGTSWNGGPSLLFSGGGGSGVDAYTRIANGSVTSIAYGSYNIGTPSCAGHGYASAPTVTVLNWRAYLRFEGQNKDTTFIRLKDHAPHFSNANCNVAMAGAAAREVCQAVIYTASEIASGSAGLGEDAYTNDIWNLTVQTGSGNPGAIALDWVASNRGSIRNVNLVSGDRQGRCGLNVSRSHGSGNGPGYVKNLSVTGFDYGIDADADATEVGLTFEHINLASQNVYGVWNSGMPNWFRSVSSNNAVPVFLNQGAGSLSVVDGQFANGDSGASAILDQSSGHGLLYARNVATSGYRSALASGSSNAAVDGATIAEYASNGVASLFSSAQSSLNLPIEETPEWVDNNFADWADVTAYGAQPNEWRDVTDGIQAALNSGKPVVFFPYGNYSITRTLHIPSTVRKIMGSNSFLNGVNGQHQNGPVFSCDSQSGNPVEIRNFGLDTATLGYPGVLNNCSSTLVLADILNARGYVNTSAGTGKLFLEDTALPGLVNVSNQQVWARQLDIEDGVNPHMAYTGGKAWILGYKTEGASSLLSATNSQVEVIGAFHSNNQAVSPLPAYTFTNTAFSLAGLSMYNGWPTVVSESRGGVVKNIGSNNAWQGGPGFSLFSGHP